MLYHEAENQNKAVNLGAINVIVRGLNFHKNNAVVCRYGCAALTSLTSYNGNLRTTLKRSPWNNAPLFLN